MNANQTYDATFRLRQESGVQGPSQTVQVESIQHAKESAVAWSMGQTGYPWDVLTIEIPELDCVVEIRPGEVAEVADMRSVKWDKEQTRHLRTRLS